MVRIAVSIALVALSVVAVVTPGATAQAGNSAAADAKVVAAEGSKSTIAPTLGDAATGTPPAGSGTVAAQPAQSDAAVTPAPVAAPIDVIVPPVKRVQPKPVVLKPTAKEVKPAAKTETKPASKIAEKPPVKTKPNAVTENVKGGKKAE